jgi:hypothetical protein
VCAYSAKAWAKPALSKAAMWRSNSAFAELQNDRLLALAADLVCRAVIAVNSTQGAQVAKAATTEIPIVFSIGGGGDSFYGHACQNGTITETLEHGPNGGIGPSHALPIFRITLAYLLNSRADVSRPGCDSRIIRCFQLDLSMQHVRKRRLAILRTQGRQRRFRDAGRFCVNFRFLG